MEQATDLLRACGARSEGKPTKGGHLEGIFYSLLGQEGQF